MIRRVIIGTGIINVRDTNISKSTKISRLLFMTQNHLTRVIVFKNVWLNFWSKCLTLGFIGVLIVQSYWSII